MNDLMAYGQNNARFGPRPTLVVPFWRVLWAIRNRRSGSIVLGFVRRPMVAYHKNPIQAVND